MSVIIQFIEHDLCHKTADTNYKHSYLGLSFVLKMYASYYVVKGRAQTDLL